jgi:hypothetical protein
MPLEFDVQIATLTEYDADGFIGLQVDGYGPDAGLEPVEMHGFAGFLARPADPVLGADGEPDPANSHAVLHATEGGRGHAWPLGHPGQLAKLPRLPKGSAIFYAPGAAGSWMLFDGTTGTWELSTKGADGATTAPRAGGIRLDVAAGTLTLDMQGGGKVEITASTIALTGAGGEKITMESGKITVDAPIVNLGDAGAQFLALASLVDANFAAIKRMFTTWVPVASDGGAALKAVSAALVFPSVATKKARGT